jgi:uncharacterized protein
MFEEAVEGVLRPGINPMTAGHPGFGYRRDDRGDVIVERDVPIPLRQGLTLYGDIYRPAGQVDVPVIVCYAPFGKHPHIDMDHVFAGSDVPKTISPGTPFEVFDPYRWAPEGFAICTVDAVGNWYSEGTARYFDTVQEAEAGYDVVEWAAKQPWSNGNVAWGGVSYYAMTGWSVAALNPPHLRAVYAHDAASDNYRETNFKGGIPVSPLTHNWMLLTGIGLGLVEDMEAGTREHPLFDEYWSRRVADWAAIKVPFYAVTEWGNDLHSRGTIEAWKHISSSHKFLDITGGKEWAEFYSEVAFARQRAFLGQFLLGEENSADSWPPVRLGIRHGGRDWRLREEEEWPPARTQYRALFLDANAGALTDAPAYADAVVGYDSLDRSDRVTFEYLARDRTEITGHAKVRLWISTDGSNDADLFVGFEVVNCDGHVVPFVFSQMYDDGPAAFGWLRASHRELDEERSTPHQPVHLHQRRQWLVHGEPVAVDVEIWPTSIVLEAGERLRLVVQGSELHVPPAGSGYAARLGPLHNFGHHFVHTGPGFDSQVLIPVIPPRQREALPDEQVAEK